MASCSMLNANRGEALESGRGAVRRAKGKRVKMASR
jgi:hypothetical protein